MSDEQLSQAEHDAMRRRVMAGAKRIHPVGRHRNAVIAGSAAVVLVLGLAGGAWGLGRLLGTGEPVPAVTPTPTRTASPTPTPTPTAETPRVAFDGDCTKVLTDEEVSALIGASLQLDRRDADLLLSSEKAAATILGGLFCDWIATGGDEVGVTILPFASVAEDVRARYGTAGCQTVEGALECALGRVAGTMWVGASSRSAVGGPEAASDQQRAAAEGRLNALLDQVQARASGQTAAAQRAGAGWWTVPPCESLTHTVAASSRLSVSADRSLGGVLHGMRWDTVRSAGADQVCSYFTESGAGVQMSITPGAGAPPDAAIVESGAQPVVEAGADAAWLVTDVRDPDRPQIIAVAGPNRLSLRFFGMDEDTARSVTAAVLTRLG